MSAGKLDVRIENEQNEVHLENTLPQTEESGKQNTPYTFDVVNKGNINAMYDLSLEIQDDSTISEGCIRYYLTKIVNDKEVRVDKKISHLVTDGIDSTNQNRKLYKIHTKDLLKPGESVSYKLYLWVDYDTTTEQAINKVFKANVRVDASQAIEKKESLLRKVDVSEGEKVTDLHDDIYNEKFAQTNVSIKNIKLEGNFKNIPKGLYTGNENITEVLLPSTVLLLIQERFLTVQD